MIITRTPFRVSFAGGGSDLASFYEKAPAGHEACVVSTSINKYMYVTIHPSFNRDITSIKYSQTENVKSVRDIKHPIVRQLLLDYKIDGVEISSTADVPSGTGLSTSSAFTVGLVNARLRTRHALVFPNLRRSASIRSTFSRATRPARRTLRNFMLMERNLT